MLAVLRFEEPGKRLDPAHDHQEVVLAAEREYGIDEIVTCALISEVYFQPVGEKGYKCLNLWKIARFCLSPRRLRRARRLR
jgi:hypothetical protein